MTTPKTRNGFIDVQRFFYCWIIVLLHFYIDTRAYFMGGGSAVEFYILISGVFFFRSFSKKKTKILASKASLDSYPLIYIKDRFLRFFPYTSVAFIITFFIRYIFANLYVGKSVQISALCNRLSKDIWEFFLIKMNGINKNGGFLNGPIWYISALLIVEFIVICILVRKERLFYTILAPLSLLIGYGFWGAVDDSNHYLWRGFTTFGVMRVFLATCLSYYTWRLSVKLAQIKFTSAGRFLLTFIELSCHAMAVVIAMYTNTRYYRWITTLLFVIGIAITLSNHSYTANLFKQSKLTNWLAELSMAIFFIHMPVLYFFEILCGSNIDRLYPLILPFLVSVFFVSVCYMYGIRRLISAGKKCQKFLYSLLIQQ